jgi:hypothetical protein
MKKALSISSIVAAAGVGATAAVWLSNKPNRVKAETVLRDVTRKIKPTVFAKSEQLPIEKAGHPDPEDTADTKMVDEGAQYSVQFYNEKVQ